MVFIVQLSIVREKIRETDIEVDLFYLIRVLDIALETNTKQTN